MRKSTLIIGVALAALSLLAGCGDKGDICDPCDDNDDCKGDLTCERLGTEWRCSDSPWRTCLTKSHLTAP